MVSSSQPYAITVLKDVCQRIKLSMELTEPSLNIIINVFGDLTVPAMSIIDNKGVKKLVSSSGKSVFQVTGSSNNEYTCFLNELYCSCISFQNNVIMKGSHVICKHLLAVIIASALENVVEISKSEACINRLLTFEGNG